MKATLPEPCQAGPHPPVVIQTSQAGKPQGYGYHVLQGRLDNPGWRHLRPYDDAAECRTSDDRMIFNLAKPMNFWKPANLWPEFLRHVRSFCVLGLRRLANIQVRMRIRP